MVKNRRKTGKNPKSPTVDQDKEHIANLPSLLHKDDDGNHIPQKSSASVSLMSSSFDPYSSKNTDRSDDVPQPSQTLSSHSSSFGIHKADTRGSDSTSNSSSNYQSQRQEHHPNWIDTDDGTPSSDLHRDVLRSLKLIRQERHLVAHALYEDIQRRVEEYRGRQRRKQADGNHDEEDVEKQHAEQQNFNTAVRELERHAQDFEKLQHRAKIFEIAQKSLVANKDWITSHTTKTGITTSYRHEPDKTLSIRIEGDINHVPLLHQLAVMRESDLYHHWAPFCSDSRKLAELGLVDIVAWQKIGGMGMMRDLCYRALGCDSLHEDGRILLVGQGVGSSGYIIDDDDEEEEEKEEEKEEEEYGNTMENPHHKEEASDMLLLKKYFDDDAVMKNIVLPDEPTGFGAARLRLRKFEALIEVTSPTSAKTKVIGNIDPRIRFLPQSLIDFVMKKMCGKLLCRLQAAAEKAVEKPTKSVHAVRMREDSTFYDGFIYPKFQQYCTLKGWDLSSLPDSYEQRREGGGDEETKEERDITTSDIYSQGAYLPLQGLEPNATMIDLPMPPSNSNSTDQIENQSIRSAPTVLGHNRDFPSSSSSRFQRGTTPQQTTRQSIRRERSKRAFGNNHKEFLAHLKPEQKSRLEYLKQKQKEIATKKTTTQPSMKLESPSPSSPNSNSNPPNITAETTTPRPSPSTELEYKTPTQQLNDSFTAIIEFLDTIPSNYILPSLLAIATISFGLSYACGNYFFTWQIQDSLLSSSKQFFQQTFMATLLLFLLFSLHWLVITAAIVLAFDNVDILNGKILPSTREYFVNNVKYITLWLSGGITAFSIGVSTVRGAFYAVNNIWDYITMEGYREKNAVATVAEGIEILSLFIFNIGWRIVKAIRVVLYTVLYSTGISSMSNSFGITKLLGMWWRYLSNLVISKVTLGSDGYSFWKYSVDVMTNLMLFTTVLVFVSIAFCTYMFQPNNEGFESVNEDVPSADDNIGTRNESNNGTLHEIEASVNDEVCVEENDIQEHLSYGTDFRYADGGDERVESLLTGPRTQNPIPKNDDISSLTKPGQRIKWKSIVKIFSPKKKFKNADTKSVILEDAMGDESTLNLSPSASARVLR